MTRRSRASDLRYLSVLTFVFFTIILISPSPASGQIIYLPPTPPDLQVTEMKYNQSECAMYFRVKNAGGPVSKFNMWVNYYPLRRVVLPIPQMAANRDVWIKQSMWSQTSYGKTCSMSNVTTVSTVANARYLYKYQYNQWVIGDVLPPGSSVPAGWSVSTPVGESNITNNILKLPKSSLPLLTFSMQATYYY